MSRFLTAQKRRLAMRILMYENIPTSDRKGYRKPGSMNKHKCVSIKSMKKR